MIVGHLKPLEEIVATISEYRKVLVVGCGGCVSVCLTGGDREARSLARELAYIEALRSMHDDPDFKGVHASVGLSNFTVMLPPKRADGSPIKSPLESAFITLAMPLGLDFVIGSVKRKYALLEPGDPALQCLQDVLNLEGYDCVMKVMEYYS